ncbi:rap domain-containing protein [Cystoisospora suis]|uniref:Rap domain-containing protein n=1 Tax=Cystoisospora suis TaxID=483139 RepID=A0A2C6LCF8_9APIC|nr:rap domain-containing protein [Cystoisospora suis]
MAGEIPHRRHSPPPSFSSASSARRHTSTIMPYPNSDLSILVNNAGHVPWLPPVSCSPSSLCTCNLALILSPPLSSSSSSSPHQSSSSSHSSSSASMGFSSWAPFIHPSMRWVAQPLAFGVSSAFSSPPRPTSLSDSLLSCQPSSVSPSPLPLLLSQFRTSITSRRSRFPYRSHLASSSCARPKKGAPRHVCCLPLSLPPSYSFAVCAVSSVFLLFPPRSSVVSRLGRGRSFASCSSASHCDPSRAGCSIRRTLASSCNPLSFHPFSSQSSPRPMPYPSPRSQGLYCLGPGVSPGCLCGRRSFSLSRGTAVPVVIYRRSIVRSHHTRTTAKETCTNLQRRDSALSRKHLDCFVNPSPSQSFFRHVPSLSYPSSIGAVFGIRVWSSFSSFSRRFSFTGNNAYPCVCSWSPSSERERLKFTHSFYLLSLGPPSVVPEGGSLSGEVHERPSSQVRLIRQLSACDVSCFPRVSSFLLGCSKSPMYLDEGFFSRQDYGSPSVSLSPSPLFLLSRCMYTSAAGKPRRLTIIPIEEEESDNRAPSSREQQENALLLPPETSLCRLDKPDLITLYRRMRSPSSSILQDGDYWQLLLSRTERLCPILLPHELCVVSKALKNFLPSSVDARAAQTALLRQIVRLPRHAYHPLCNNKNAGVIASLFNLLPLEGGRETCGWSPKATNTGRDNSLQDDGVSLPCTSPSSLTALLPGRRERRRADTLFSSPEEKALVLAAIRHLSGAFLEFYAPLRSQKHSGNLNKGNKSSLLLPSRGSAQGTSKPTSVSCPSREAPSSSLSITSDTSAASTTARGRTALNSTVACSPTAEAKHVREVVACYARLQMNVFFPAEEVQQVFKHLGDYLTLHGMGSLTGKDAAIILNSFAACGQIHHHHLFREIARRLPVLAHQMKPAHVALTANALARADVRVLGGLRALSVRARETLDDFEPQDISNLLNGFGKLQIVDPELFESAAPKVCAAVRFYNPQHLANIAHAYSKVSVHHTLLFDRIAEMARRSIQNFRSQELANLAMAFARLDIRHKGLLVSLADEVLYRGTVGVSFGKKFHFDLLSIQQLTSAFARLGLHDPRLFFVLARLSKEGVRRALVYGRLPEVAADTTSDKEAKQPKSEKSQRNKSHKRREIAKDKSGALVTVATGSHTEVHKKKSPHMSIKWRREYEAAKGRYRLDGQVLASLTHALGRANVPLSDVQSLHGVLSRAILKLEKSFSALSLAQLSAGCHLLGLRDGRVSRLLLRQAEARVSQFPAGALVLLLTSFGNLGLYNASFTREAVRMARLYLASYTAPELAAVVVALENLHFRHEAFLNKTARALVARRYDLSPRSLCGVLGAFAKLGMEDEKLYDVLFDEVFANQHKLSQSNALSALYALVLVDSRAEDRAAGTPLRILEASVKTGSGGKGQDRSYRDTRVSPAAQTTVIQQRETSCLRLETGEQEASTRESEPEKGTEGGSSLQHPHRGSRLAEDQEDLRSACSASPPSSPSLSGAKRPRNWMQERFALLQSLLYAAFRDQKRLLVGSVSRLQLVDLYLRLFRPSIFASLPFELKAFLARVRSVDLAEADCFALSSRMHRDVSNAFLRVGIFHRSEVQLGPFSLDLVVGDRLAVEVDGPSHFYRETCMRTASSRLKQKLVRAMGWKLLKISYLEWQQLVTPERKLAYAAAFWRPILASHYAKTVTRTACEVLGTGDESRRQAVVEEASFKNSEDLEGGSRGIRCIELKSVEVEGKEKGRDMKEVNWEEGEEGKGQAANGNTRPTLQDFLWLLEEQGGDALITRSRLVRAMERYRKLFLFPSPHVKTLVGSVDRRVIVSRLLPPGPQAEPEVWRAMKGRPATKLLSSSEGVLHDERGRFESNEECGESRIREERPSCNLMVLSSCGSVKDPLTTQGDDTEVMIDTTEKRRGTKRSSFRGQRRASSANVHYSEIDASRVYHLTCNPGPAKANDCEVSSDGETEESKEKRIRETTGNITRLVQPLPRLVLPPREEKE